MPQFLDALESRICFAATLEAGVLTVTGTTGNDVIELDLRDDGTLKVEINTVETSFDYAAITSFAIDSGVGNDQVEFNQRNVILKGARIVAGLGRDTVEAAQGRDTIFGGSGNDTLDGREGSDIIYGDGGNDVIEGKNGNDKLYGGSGNDRIQGAIGTDTIVGGPGDDDLEGGSGTDRLSGGSGNDDFQDGRTVEIVDRLTEDNGPNALIDV